MRRFSKALAAFACVLACGAAAAQDVRTRLDEFSPEFRALRIQIARALVKVEVVNQNGSYSLGTGVVVAPGKAVTNCHVTRDAAQVRALWGGLRYEVGAQHADTAHDLCLLHVPRLEVAPAILATAHSRPSQFILAAGFVGGQGLQVAQGEVVALHALDGGKVIQSTTAFTSGASGGGLFNLRGELLGVLTFRLRGADAYYFSAPAQWIGALQRTAATRVAPLSGVAFWQAQGAALPYFLQAAPLEAQGKWDELVRLSERWAAAEQRSAEAWLARGHAYAQLKRGDAAIHALRRAVELDPDSEMAWYKLGVAHAGDCDRAELRRIAATLERLDQQLSARLMRAVSHATPETQTKSLAC